MLTANVYTDPAAYDWSRWQDMAFKLQWLAIPMYVTAGCAAIVAGFIKFDMNGSEKAHAYVTIGLAVGVVLWNAITMRCIPGAWGQMLRTCSFASIAVVLRLKIGVRIIMKLRLTFRRCQVTHHCTGFHAPPKSCMKFDSEWSVVRSCNVSSGVVYYEQAPAAIGWQQHCICLS